MPISCNIVIQKIDKANSVITVETDVYLRHMETILSDVNKFEKGNIKKGTLKFSINHEKYINNYLKRHEKPGSLSTEEYKNIKAVESRTGTLYETVNYIKLLLMFFHHLDLCFWQLNLLVTDL